jgi:formate C-acetyltransferase
VFDAYTPEIMNCRRFGAIDTYGRGRIIGDYRCVVLYVVDRLLEVKREERDQIDDMWPTDDVVRSREGLSEQVRALNDLAAMAKLYGHYISRPAANAQEPNGLTSPMSARSRKPTAPRC